MSVVIKVSRIHEEAVLPTKAHADRFSDAAFDLYASPVMFPWVIVDAGKQAIVPTGIRVAIPDGYWIKFRERSGLASKGIHILGGVIDSGYTGELMVIMYNSGQDQISIPAYKAIAQFTVERVIDTTLELISESDMEFEAFNRSRASNGFGSSDVSKG